jgi:hypothetical protein
MPARTFAGRILSFYRNLDPPRVPRGVGLLNPYGDARILAYVSAFLRKYLDDNCSRVLVLGINPGRFGAGVTGVTFTDPVALADHCGIPNHLPRRRELSSVFIYDFIEAAGGPAAFYGRFFLSAASPLGFTRGGLNLNYYDEPGLARAVEPFIARSIAAQIRAGCRTDAAIVLGMGTNLKFLRRLNDRHGFFDRLHALEHPRFILQYRRRQAAEYIEKYRNVFENVGTMAPPRR